MSRNSHNQDNPEVNFADADNYVIPDVAAPQIEPLTEKELKKEVSRLNAEFVNGFKSDLTTFAIAMRSRGENSINVSDAVDFIEFYYDTHVDKKLVNRAIRALVKSGKFVMLDKKTFAMSEQRAKIIDAFAEIKANRPHNR